MLERRNLILCAFALTVLFSCSPADGLFGQNFAASSGGKEKKWLLAHEAMAEMYATAACLGL